MTAATEAYRVARLASAKRKISNVAAPVTSAAATHTLRCLRQSQQRTTPPPAFRRTLQAPPIWTMSPT
ncbi:MAG: hypothetical protein JO272_17035 [Pseudonocardiales bacterium]|nr:hypothetical protein [Pseudonocardiales bacterium]